MDVRHVLFVIPLSLALLGGSVVAAEASGRIWYSDSKRPAVGLQVVVTCSQGKPQMSQTDQYGFYRVPNLPARQNCVVVINSGQRHSTQLSYYSGNGRQTQNFSVLVQGNRLLVTKQ